MCKGVFYIFSLTVNILSNRSLSDGTLPCSARYLYSSMSLSHLKVMPVLHKASSSKGLFTSKLSHIAEKWLYFISQSLTIHTDLHKNNVDWF